MSLMPLEMSSFTELEITFWNTVSLLNYKKIETSTSLRKGILGDPGEVSRVGRKGGTNVFKYGRKSPWVPTLTELFPKIQADAGS